jgi:hypothetical protein
MATTPRTTWRVPHRTGRGRLVTTSLLGMSLLVLATMFGGAQASPNLVLDGNFAQASLSPSGSGYMSFELGSWSYNSTNYTTTLANWTNASGAYNYVMTSGTAAALGQYGTLTLADGSAIGTAPGGGNFLANDGDYNSGTVSQTVTGLTIGAPTTLAFWWGAGIQNGYSTPNTENWQASLCPISGCVGNDTQNAASYTLTAVDFSGWMQATMTFIPTSTSEVLSFLAIGTGAPPFLLLADISVTTPEPGTLAVMITALVGLGVLSRLRRRSARQDAASA